MTFSRPSDKRKPPPGPATQPSPIKRRERRAAVEDMMVSGHLHLEIAKRISEQFDISVRTVWSDIKRVRTRWDREERSKGTERREMVVRILIRNARACHEADDLKGERDAAFKLARVLGLGLQQTLIQDNRHQEVHVHTAKMPESPEEQQAWLDDYVRASCEMEGVPVPELPATIDVIDVSINGRAKDGATTPATRKAAKRKTTGRRKATKRPA